MTGPVPPDDPLAALASELGELSRRLAGVQERLLAMRTDAATTGGAAPEGGVAEGGTAAGPTWPAAEAWAPPQPAPPQPWGPPVSPGPLHPVTPPPYGYQGQYGYPAQHGYPQYGHPQPAGPAQTGFGAAGPGPAGSAGFGAAGPAGFGAQTPPRPMPPRPPREGLGPQLVAWTGGTVTLLGIVLLLVLAASRGWLQPGARVIGGALLALALIAVAAWVHRRPGGQTGAVALAATGVAGLYLDVVAATALYEYLPVAGGLVVAVLVAGGGLALADWWRSQPLAAGAVAGAAILAPILTKAASPLLVALAVVLQLAAAPVVLRRQWTVLAAVAAVWPFGYGLLAVAMATDDGTRYPQTTAAVAAVLLVGAGLAVGATGRLPVLFSCVQLAAAAVPVLSMALVLDRAPGAVTALLVAVLMLVVSAPVERSPVPREVCAVAIVMGALAAFEATMIALRGGTQTAVVLSEAIVLAAAAIAVRRRSVLVAAAGFGAVGTFLALFRDAPLRALLTFPSRPYIVSGDADTAALVTGAGVSALVLVAAVVMFVAADRLDLLGPRAEAAPVWITAAAIVLYGAAGLLVTGALLVTATRGGFLAGHVLVTVSWTVAALILLVRGIRQQALRVAGGALVVAAVAKLVLFDLSQLDGLARVAAFLGAGLVLLAAGTRYARLVAAAQAERAERAERAEPDQSTLP